MSGRSDAGEVRTKAAGARDPRR